MTTSSSEEMPDPALDLVNAAMVAKLAGALGAPHLAVRAARHAGQLADAYVIGLSPMLARTSPEAEDKALAGVVTTASLCRLLSPEPVEEAS